MKNEKLTPISCRTEIEVPRLSEVNQNYPITSRGRLVRKQLFCFVLEKGERNEKNLLIQNSEKLPIPSQPYISFWGKEFLGEGKLHFLIFKNCLFKYMLPREES